MASLYRSRATLTTSGVPCLITTYWQKDIGVSDTDAATEAMARVRACFASAAGLIASGSSLVFDPAVQIINDTDGALTGVGVGTLPASVTFSGATDPLPLQTQGLARYSTAAYIRGRNLKGRMFLPGPCEANNTTGGVPASTYISGWNTALGLLGTTVVSGITQVVWSRPTGPGATDGQFGSVSGRTCASVWAVQKGRRN